MKDYLERQHQGTLDYCRFVVGSYGATAYCQYYAVAVAHAELVRERIEANNYSEPPILLWANLGHYPNGKYGVAFEFVDCTRAADACRLTVCKRDSGVLQIDIPLHTKHKTLEWRTQMEIPVREVAWDDVHQSEKEAGSSICALVIKFGEIAPIPIGDLQIALSVHSIQTGWSRAIPVSRSDWKK